MLRVVATSKARAKVILLRLAKRALKQLKQTKSQMLKEIKTHQSSERKHPE